MPPCERLFDHLVGAAEECQRHTDAKRLRGLEVDAQLDLGGLLDRQVGRLFAFEDAGDITAGEAISVGEIGAVADQAAGHDEIAARADRWHAVADRQCGELSTVAGEERISGADYQPAWPKLADLGKRQPRQPVTGVAVLDP
jgi:hypothetical protein